LPHRAPIASDASARRCSHVVEEFGPSLAVLDGAPAQSASNRASSIVRAGIRCCCGPAS
jgi:hypothetical protein